MPDASHEAPYRYAGARALVRLHERHLWEFWATWCEARAAQVRLPDTDDPNYASLETLLHHLLRSARGYLQWICRQLQLPDPGIDPAPPAECAADQGTAYLRHLLQRWRTPLSGVEAQAFRDRTYPLTWQPPPLRDVGARRDAPDSAQFPASQPDRRPTAVGAQRWRHGPAETSAST